MEGRVIWGEVLFCIDFSMDFCALYFTCKLLGYRIIFVRLLTAAALCAAAGVLCAGFLSGLSSVFIMLISWICIAWLLFFNIERKISRIISAFLIFVFLEATAGGIMTAVFYYMNRQFGSLHLSAADTSSKQKLFFICAGVLFAILSGFSRLLSNAEVKKLVQRNGLAVIRWNGKTTAVSCLFDSGNLVKEPISGRSVMILPYREQLSLGIDPTQLENGSIAGSRLISMRSLDRAYLLWGILPQEISISAENLELHR
ncbi:MAG: sigma-E processing peptidase SpoIIGA, partial [Clostridia bacterium]|nr:sigma-E processing peptidase SpoIIGA [Clostridia bacterium]